MQKLHDELISLMHMRMEYVGIIAALKFILKKPIYAPSVEQELCHHLMEVASQFGLNASLVENFMNVLYKISREIQQKMHVIWSLEEEACIQFLLSQMNNIPVLQGNTLKNKLNVLDVHARLFCEQLIHLVRISIRFLDLQIMSLFSCLTENFTICFIKEQVSYWRHPPNEILLNQLFLLMNEFVNRVKRDAKQHG